jgi:hypothetical protein
MSLNNDANPFSASFSTFLSVRLEMTTEMYDAVSQNPWSLLKNGKEKHRIELGLSNPLRHEPRSAISSSVRQFQIDPLPKNQLTVGNRGGTVR